MKLKCNTNSLFIVFSLNSWLEKWRTKWKITLKSNKLSKISEQLQVCLTSTKSYKISWLGSKLILIYSCRFLTMKEKLINWDLITSHKPKDSMNSRWKTRKMKEQPPRKRLIEVMDQVMDSTMRRLTSLMERSKFSLKKRNKLMSSTRKLILSMTKFMIGAQKSFRKSISNSMRILQFMKIQKPWHSSLKRYAKQFATNLKKSSRKKMTKTEVTSPKKISWMISWPKIS